MPKHRFNMAGAVEGVHYTIHEGRVYPIIRGGADGDPPADPAAPPADPATPPPADHPAPPPAADPPKDPGFPADTPVADMTPEQQAKYHQAQSRKHEARAKATAAELEKIKNANLSDTEKALKEAEQRGAKTAAEGFGLKLAAAELKAAGVPADKVADLNLSGLLDDNGEVDAVKVAELASRHKATAPARPGSADGGPQGDTPTTPTLDEQIAAAQAKGDSNEVIRLNSQKLALMGTP